MTPGEALEALASSRSPFLVGVRHHSPACAAAMEPLLEAAQPERLFVELPPELGPWLPWLGHEATEAPVALAAVEAGGRSLAFYPFADFSPELAAIRWALRRGVPVEPFDLPLARRPREGAPPALPRRGLLRALFATAGVEDGEELWDRLVEARAPGNTPEAVRRAALLAGWAMRADAAQAGVPREDAMREHFMRSRLEEFGAYGKSPRRSAAVVGAFHASALLGTPWAWSPSPPPEESGREVITSLIAYAFDLLDSRSGYPAGIRDPVWQQASLAAHRAADPPAEVDAALCRLVLDICRAVRREGHAAGTPEAREAIRLARDLARLRNIPAPSRRELVEAVQAVLGRGEALGFGRVLARAMDEVLVGRRRGRVAPGAPRCGLLAHVEALVGALGLPGPRESMAKPVELRLDPARSDLDRRRHVALERLRVCGVTYAAREEVRALGPGEALGTAWAVQWQPATEALIELAGLRGVTLEQAAEGALRAALAEALEAEELSAQEALELLEAAARAGLGALVLEWLAELEQRVVSAGGLKELLRAAALLEGFQRGLCLGLPPPGEASAGGAPGAVRAFVFPGQPRPDDLVAAAVRALEGMTGSNASEDARAVHDLVEVFRRRSAGAEPQWTAGGTRLGATVDGMARDGSPLMQGAAAAAQLVLGRRPAAEVSERIGSWVDGASAPEARAALSARLGGLLIAGATLMESDVSLLDGVVARVEALEDAPFLERLPRLREGFDVLSPAARQRLLDALAERYPGAFGAGPAAAAAFELEAPPEWLRRFAAADQAGAAGVKALRIDERVAAQARPVARGFEKPPQLVARPDRALSVADRWRLILGREREKVAPRATPVFRALDELYGYGRGEGSRGGGGMEAPFPTAREWAAELEALFGAKVREEVLGRALERGHRAAALELDPEGVTPSIELLEQILSLKGGLGEAGLERLRRLVARVVEELVEALATRIQPAFAGLTVPRPSRRRSDRLDLRRTVAENLRWATVEDGRWRLAPRRLSFKSRGRRSIDWQIVLAVDVSGSMEPSVLYSAMMAAILARLPAVSVRFLAFSTEVIDLSEHVEDPLALLLEVRVGGGTHIAKALRYARQLVAVPNRTLVLTVSDFEEGAQVDGLLSEVRAMSEAGIKMLGVATLDDSGRPRYHKAIAELVAGAGMPVAALTPLELARWVGEQLR